MFHAQVWTYLIFWLYLFLKKLNATSTFCILYHHFLGVILSNVLDLIVSHTCFGTFLCHLFCLIHVLFLDFKCLVHIFGLSSFLLLFYFLF